MLKEAAISKYRAAHNNSALFSSETSFSVIGIPMEIQTSHLQNRDQKP